MIQAEQVRAEVDGMVGLDERRMSAFFNNACAGLCVLDLQLRYVRINEVLAQINGIPPEQHVGRTVREVLPDVAPTLEPIFERVIETKEPVKNVNLSGRVPGDPDHLHHWIGSYFPLLDDSGECIGVGCSVIDITEQKRVEQALRESETKFRQLAENIHTVFWITNLDCSEVVYISPAYEKIWGRKVEDLYRQPHQWVECILPQDRDAAAAAFADLARGVRARVSVEYRVRRPDGAVSWILDNGFPIFDENGKLYRIAGVAQDMTERKLLEQQLRESQKMEAIGQLAGGIAHDFNNVLGCILGYAELIEQAAPKGTDMREDCRQIVEATTRAQQLVEQILTFSREEHRHRRPIELRGAVEDGLALLRASLPSTIELRLRDESGLPVVLADDAQIRQALVNLVTNGAHAMKMRGEIEISLETEDVAAERARANPQLRAGRYAVVSVKDTGSGMDDATMARIFEPFFTTKAPDEGRGLGLAVVHGIMRAHEGAIDVESSPGQGATFRLYFPAYTGKKKTTVSKWRGPSPRGRGERVLFVDDEATLAVVGKRMLEQAGYAVTAMTNPRDALTLFRAEPDRFDLVITDFTMPRMTGVELARALLALRPTLPIVMTTGFGGGMTQEKARELGIRALIFKPAGADALGDAAHTALARG